MEEIVKLNIDYTYEVLVRDIQALQNRYPFLEVRQYWRKRNGQAHILHQTWIWSKACNV